MSRRSAIKCFGVAATTAAKWHRRYQKTGSVSPGKIGGHHQVMEPRRGLTRGWLE